MGGRALISQSILEYFLYDSGDSSDLSFPTTSFGPRRTSFYDVAQPEDESDMRTPITDRQFRYLIDTIRNSVEKANLAKRQARIGATTAVNAAMQVMAKSEQLSHDLNEMRKVKAARKDTTKALQEFDEIAEHEKDAYKRWVNHKG